MKRIFISLPMNGRTDDEIQKECFHIVDLANEQHIFADEGEDVIFDWNTDCNPEFFVGLKNRRLVYLGEAIKKLGYADGVIFGEFYESARGCKVELKTCVEYGIPMYFVRDGKILEYKDYCSLEIRDYMVQRGLM